MAINDTYWALGHKLKNVRIQHGKTLTEVADTIGFTPQFLSMVEKGKSGISFPNLLKISSLYGMTIAELVDDKETSQRVLRLDQAERLGVSYDGVEALLLYRSSDRSKPEIVYFRIEPNASTGYTQHEGAEVVFVVDGSLEFSFIDSITSMEEKYVLGKGDTVQHASHVMHKCENTSNKVGVFIVIYFNSNEL